MFDEYAPDFEASLVEGLGYRIPEEIELSLVAALPEDAREAGILSRTVAVDLGCGTGLAGAQLVGRCSGHIVGCDLSEGMLARARKKTHTTRGKRAKVYRDLQHCDAAAFMHRFVAQSGCDLVVAADVLVYMRALDGLMAEVARGLAPGGTFAFSTEACSLAEGGGAPPGGQGWIERSTERIAHSEAYVRHVVQQTCVLELVGLREVVARRDGIGDILSHVCVVVKRG